MDLRVEIIASFSHTGLPPLLPCQNFLMRVGDHVVKKLLAWGWGYLLMKKVSKIVVRLKVEL